MDGDPITNNYSAEVDLRMDCGPYGEFALSQACSTFVISATPVSVPPCVARIILIVDGQRFDRPVQLVKGLSPDCREALVLSHDAVSPF